MSNSQNIFHAGEITRYIPAILHEQKCGVWKIEYYALNPQTKKLQRMRIRVDKIRNAYSRKTDARRHIAEMCQMINAKLSGGWSPFFECEDARLYTTYTQVIAEFLESKSRELRPAKMRSYQSFCKMLSERLDIASPKMYFSMFNHYCVPLFSGNMYFLHCNYKSKKSFPIIVYRRTPINNNFFLL
ncbi:MAG: hypothetical protein LBN27_08490 [Prevotellaceae bacterium]|jgi:hypothetical protein|nr:hypothetical protein [Prevotellaceae bacterium]